MSKLAVDTNIGEKGIDTSKISVVKKKIKIKKLPKIKDIKILSIDIGSKYIKILEAKKRNGVIKITLAVKVESPDDIVEGGELRNIPSIVSALNIASRKWKFKSKDVSFNSISTTIMSREISIIDSDEITATEKQMLVENELRQYLPINLSDYQIQFTEAGSFEENGVKKQRILVIVYPIKMIKAYLNLISNMENKVRPCSLDVTNNSVQKFFKHITTINGEVVDKSKVYLFIDMGRNTFNTSIIADGKLQFMRIIDASQDAIDRGIALGIGRSYEEAEIVKMEDCDLMATELKCEQAQVNKIIKTYVNKWIDELVRVTHFYSNKEEKRVDKIYLYGGGAKLNGLAEYIQARMNIETEKIVSFDGIEKDYGVNIANIDQFINCIGTTIRF